MNCESKRMTWVKNYLVKVKKQQIEGMYKVGSNAL